MATGCVATKRGINSRRRKVRVWEGEGKTRHGVRESASGMLTDVYFACELLV